MLNVQLHALLPVPLVHFLHTGVAAIEGLLSSWSGSSSKTDLDGSASSSSDEDDSEYMGSGSDSESSSGESDSDDDSASSSGSGSGSGSSDESGIDDAELEALLDESRDVLADGAGGAGGRPSKRLRR